MWKGIILAGGAGSRLYPISKVVSKQLLPVYDKPLIYYPLTTLMLAGIRDILVITTTEDQAAFQKLLGSGEQWGLNLNYAVQLRPEGLAQALLIGAEFIADNNVALILGDNIFYGHYLREDLAQAVGQATGATIFAYRVRDPERYGVIEFDANGRVSGLVEKPQMPRSNYAVTGLYFYDRRAVELAGSIRPSARGELEITDLNHQYLGEGLLNVILMGRGYAWFDAGTHTSLLQASEFVNTIQQRQGFQIACPEEIAYRLGYIDSEQMMKLAGPLLKSDYGQYLVQVIEEADPFLGVLAGPRKAASSRQRIDPS